MRTLIADGVESEPQEHNQPDAPKGKDGVANPFEMEKHKQELDRHCEKLDKCKDCKAKAFVILKGQCTLTTKNKTESSKGHKSMELNDDVIASLKSIKELSHSTINVHCSHWTMSAALKKALSAKQNDTETITACCKRFINLIKIAEVQWGQLVPTKLAELEADCEDSSKQAAVQEKTRKKFLTCVFMAGASKRHHQSIRESNNMHPLGQNDCPTSIKAAVTHLSHCMDEKDKNCTGNHNDGLKETGFTQKQIPCCDRQKPGHNAPDCPDEKKAECSDSDDE